MKISFILVAFALIGCCVGCLPTLPKETEEPQQAQPAVSIEKTAMDACFRKYPKASKAVVMACAEERSEIMHQQQPAAPAPVGIPGTPFATNALFTGSPAAMPPGIPMISDLMGSMPRLMDGHCMKKNDVTVLNRMSNLLIAVVTKDAGDFIPCVDGRGRYGARMMPVDARNVAGGYARATGPRALILPGDTASFVVSPTECRGACSVKFEIEFYTNEPIPRYIGGCSKQPNFPSRADTYAIAVFDDARTSCFNGISTPAFE